MRALSYVLFALVCHAGCLAVPGDRILARDLSRVIPEFAALAPDQALGFTPMPGSQRVMTWREIGIIARQHGIAIPASRAEDVCIISSTKVLSTELLVSAMKRALGAPSARIEVTDYARCALPDGHLEFARSGLVSPPLSQLGAPVIWRGRLIDDAGKIWPIWAKATVLVDTPVLVAVENLTPSREIESAQVAVIVRPAFPQPGTQLATSEQAVGKVVKRPIATGQAIIASMLEEPSVVQPGDSVKVSSVSGTARINFEARAVTGGRKGDSILVRNPSNGSNFHALIVGKRQVLVQVGASD
jgi:flagella basal body P-ring formation protein FlgA